MILMKYALKSYQYDSLFNVECSVKIIPSIFYLSSKDLLIDFLIFICRERKKKDVIFCIPVNHLVKCVPCNNLSTNMHIKWGQRKSCFMCVSVLSLIDVDCSHIFCPLVLCWRETTYCIMQTGTVRSLYFYWNSFRSVHC